MPGTERVVLRFIASKKSRQTARLFDRVKLIASSGKDLVRVRLVPDVPDKPIIRRIEDVVHRHSEFDGTERCARVPADAGASVDNELPYFVGDFLQILDAELSKVCR